MHWLLDGHATAASPAAGSTVAGVGVPGEAGLNVTSCPRSSTAMHSFAVGHATASSCVWPLWSIANGPDHDAEAGDGEALNSMAALIEATQNVTRVAAGRHRTGAAWLRFGPKTSAT